MRIAVVDDEQTALEAVTAALEQVPDGMDVTFQIDRFISGKAFLDAFQINWYDALFLDIDMPQYSGFSVSSFLREQGNSIPIVYITNRDDLMQKAFQYKALGFVRKNHLVEELPFAVKCVLQEIHKATKCIVLISVQKNKKTKHEVVVSDILYIDTQNHQTTFHLANNTSVVTRESLSSYTSQNAFQGFIQISSGCIVNHIHIYSIEKDTIILLNHEALYISRRRTKTVKEQFLQLSRRLIL